ncbi:potassium channel family protein [Virgibacillus halophilus]
MKHFYFRIPVLVRLLLTVLIVIISFGIIVHVIEPEEFPTSFDGIWWAFVTAATVGYGDYAPVSYLGRSVGIVLMLTGAGLLTFYISTFAAETIRQEQHLAEGKTIFKGRGHIILIGWNERTKELVNLAHKKFPNLDIVLVDRTLKKLPIHHYPVHFISGDITEDAVIRKTNINEAKSVIISADVLQKEQQADNYTVLATLAVRGNHSSIPIISEILSRKQAENAKRAGADTIIRPNDFLGSLFYHELFRQESAKPFQALLSLLKQQQFSQMDVAGELLNKPFGEAVQFYQLENTLLLGLIRDGAYAINPPHQTLLQENDKLIALISWDDIKHFK